MCGIVGVSLRDSNCDPGVLARMRDLVRHRGPDDAGNYIDGGVGLGHRRLSIIDLGGGHQPMTTPDGRFAIVYNGEIYNYRALRAELERHGIVFRTNSDTEVILELHARFGDAAATRLNGIFAYALWDREARRLLLARDRVGIKPLYYVTAGGGVAFGSEIKALFASGLVSPSLAAQHVPEYLLFRQVAGVENLFHGVVSLPPGHVLEILAGRVAAPRAFWSLGDAPRPFRGSFDDAVDALDVTLRGAISRQLMSDVPLGTFCSGGIDSSLVTAIASQIAGDQIKTFSVGFEESAYDEGEYARLAATACGTRHHELRVSEARFAELLPKLVWHHDLPLNFANSVHIYAISELARRHVTVVLTGEGADELFGGYPRYSLPRVSDLLESTPRALGRSLARILRSVPDHRARKLAAVLHQSLADTLLFNCTGIAPEAVAHLMGQALQPDSFAVRRRLVSAAVARHDDPYGAVAELDFQTYLVSILNRQDKMSMAASLEARVPFLDNELMDLARSLPQTYKQTLRHRKRVLKAVALRYLPRDIVERRKSGFGVPLPEWFRGNGSMARMLREIAEDQSLRVLFTPGSLQALITDHRSGTRDHAELLWGVLNLGLWLRAFSCG